MPIVCVILPVITFHILQEIVHGTYVHDDLASLGILGVVGDHRTIRSYGIHICLYGHAHGILQAQV